MVNAECEPITGGLVSEPLVECRNRAPGRGIRGQCPQSWTSFCIVTTRGVGHFVMKCVFAEPKHFIGRLVGHSPLDLSVMYEWKNEWNCLF